MDANRSARVSESRAPDGPGDATLVEQLCSADDDGFPALMERVRADGDPAISTLLAIVGDEVTEPEIETPAWNACLRNAVRVLAARRHVDAIEPMVAWLLRPEPVGVVRVALNRALIDYGEPAFGPLIDAYARTHDPELRVRLCSPLARLQKRDPRVFDALNECLRHDPARVAELIADYGDPRAIPVLSAVLDDYDPNTAETASDAAGTLYALEYALDRLNHRLTSVQAAKCKAAYRWAETVQAQEAYHDQDEHSIADESRVTGHSSTPSPGALANQRARERKRRVRGKRRRKQQKASRKRNR